MNERTNEKTKDRDVKKNRMYMCERMSLFHLNVEKYQEREQRGQERAGSGRMSEERRGGRKKRRQANKE